MQNIVIVGAGPTGLSLAWLLAKKHNVTIVESLPTAGGCHMAQVTREDAAVTHFTEHGPRVYTDRSKYFAHLLKDMGLSWNKLFIPYKFQISNIGDFKQFTFSELKSLTVAWFSSSAVNKTTSMYDFTANNKFTEKSRDYIDRLCRTTDGTDSRNYSVWKFLQLVNQQYLYTMFQPTSPDGLIKNWTAALIKQGVKIKTSCTVEQIIMRDIIVGINTSHGIIPADQVILACPPQQVLPILQASKLAWCLPNLTKDYLNHTSYNRYISISFIWSTDVLLNKRVWGFPSSKHGLLHVVLSDYWKTPNTVISTALTILDDLDLSDDALIATALNELRMSYPTLPTPLRSMVNHDNLTAFIQGVKPAVKLGPATLIPNLWTIGTHNGASDYAFTTIESAVESAYKFVDPSISIVSITVNNVITLLMLLIVLIATVIYLNFAAVKIQHSNAV